MTIHIRNAIYWNVTPCSSVDTCQGFVASVGMVDVTSAATTFPHSKADQIKPPWKAT